MMEHSPFQNGSTHLSDLVGRQHDDICPFMKALRGGQVSNPLSSERREQSEPRAEPATLSLYAEEYSRRLWCTWSVGAKGTTTARQLSGP